MSLYKQGARFSTLARVGNVGLEVTLPNAVAAEFARIRTVIDSINLDVSAAAKSGVITNEEWNTWRSFYVAAHKFVTDSSVWWGANVDQARRLEQDAVKWRDLLKSRGHTPSGPTNLARDPKADHGPGAPPWLYLGIVVVGVFGVSQLIGNVKR